MVGKVTFVCVQSLFTCTSIRNTVTDHKEIKLTEFVSQKSSSSSAFKPLRENHTDNVSTLMILCICRRCHPLIYLIIFQRSRYCNQGSSYVEAGTPMKAVKSFICGGNEYRTNNHGCRSTGGADGLQRLRKPADEKQVSSREREREDSTRI